MPTVHIRDQILYVNQKAVPLVSAEVHYWRLHPGCWKAILDKVKEAGISVISTYVCWDFHEYARGKFDFTGRTDSRRNLLAFLELTRKEKFLVIIRPGPYIYSEWPQDGVPVYAHAYHRLHPQFLAWARDYMRVVSEVIRPYLATRKGGHIIMFQADNEIDPWPDKFGAQYGLGNKPGLFQSFLSAKYKGRIQKLNQSWATHFKKFDDAGPFVMSMWGDDPGSVGQGHFKDDYELKRGLDFIEFKHDYARKYAEEIVRYYRKLGMDVPIYLNVYPFFYAHHWRSLQETADFIGIDIYPYNEFGKYPAEHRRALDKFRLLSEISPVSFAAEFGCGVWHPQHYKTGVFTPNHYRLLTVTAIAGGITGWNWYMFVNRDNWYMSPVDERGRTRGELFSVFRDLVRVYREMNLPACEKLTEVGATYHAMQYAVKAVGRNEPVLSSLYHADIDYDLFDPALGEPRTRILFYAGDSWISQRARRNLERYVRRGGILVAFQNVPGKDEDFKPALMSGFEEPSRRLFEFKRDFQISLGHWQAEMKSTVLCFGRPKGQRIVADFGGDYGDLCIGYIKKLGRGHLMHLGVEPSSKLMQAILGFFNIPVYCYSETPGVNTALMKGKAGRLFTAVMHNGAENKIAVICVPYLAGRKKKYKVRNLFSGKIVATFASADPSFQVGIARKDGSIFEIS